MAELELAGRPAERQGEDLVTEADPKHGKPIREFAGSPKIPVSGSNVEPSPRLHHGSAALPWNANPLRGFIRER